MTGPEDSQSTRPISVAELLARNGTIGAPPVGGRRRRRRGDTDSISVAELTGEIPIVTDHDITDQADKDVVGQADEVVADEVVADEVVADEVVADEVIEEPETQSRDAGADTEIIESVDDTETESVDEDESDESDDSDDDYAGAVSDYTAHIQQRETDVDLDFFAPPRRSSYAPRRFGDPSGDDLSGDDLSGDDLSGDAEEMSPDPDPGEDDTALDWSQPEIDDDDDIDAVDSVGDLEDDAKGSKDSESSPSYLATSAGALFGGQTVADQMARRGTSRALEDTELDATDHGAQAASPKAMSSFIHGVWIVGQCVLAVAFGAGLFVAFDQLWKWNNIVALVLSVLVILGLVVGVRVVRKTEDIGSTLIAVAVGALVTLGPLALLQSG